MRFPTSLPLRCRHCSKITVVRLPDSETREEYVLICGACGGETRVDIGGARRHIAELASKRSEPLPPLEQAGMLRREYGEDAEFVAMQRANSAPEGNDQQRAYWMTVLTALQVTKDGEARGDAALH